MPTLNWIGKDAVLRHHGDVRFQLLEEVPALSCGDDSGNLILVGDNLRGGGRCLFVMPRGPDFAAIAGGTTPVDLAERLRERFAPLGNIDLALPKRKQASATGFRRRSMSPPVARVFSKPPHSPPCQEFQSQ